MTRDLGLQPCASGPDVTWKAHAPQDSAQQAPSGASVQITITEDPEGKFAVTFAQR